MIEGSGAGSVPLTNGSRSRIKEAQNIRIRIPNTARNVIFNKEISASRRRICRYTDFKLLLLQASLPAGQASGGTGTTFLHFDYTPTPEQHSSNSPPVIPPPAGSNSSPAYGSISNSSHSPVKRTLPILSGVHYSKTSAVLGACPLLGCRYLLYYTVLVYCSFLEELQGTPRHFHRFVVTCLLW